MSQGLRSLIIKSLGVSALLAVTTIVAFADVDNDRSVIVVNGSCERSSTPDQVEVLVGVRVRHVEATKAVEVAMPTYEKLLKKIKSLGLKDAEFETSDMDVRRLNEYVSDKKIDRSYEAHYAFRVITGDTARVGDVFKVARDLGANEVMGPRHRLSKKLYKKEYEACLQDAVLNARAKAETLAKAMNVQLSRQVKITEENIGGMGYSPQPMADMHMAKEASFSPSVEARKQDVKVSLNAAFFLKE